MNTAAKQLYQSLRNEEAQQPLPAGDKRYVPILHNAGQDPIVQLQLRIEMAQSHSVNLLTGYRGNGKSTELRRLQHQLQQTGCTVILLDMSHYIAQTKPVEISDFLLSLMAALAEAAQAKTGLDHAQQTYWERLTAFFKTTIRPERLQLSLQAFGSSANLGLALQRDPDFKHQLQQQLRGYTQPLVDQARAFVTDIVDTLRAQAQDPAHKVVVLVDSLEQIRGAGSLNASQEVQQSVTQLFADQADNLKFPLLHLVYTIPPYVPILAPSLGRLLGGHPITSWPNVHVQDRTGQPDPAGLQIMLDIIERRYSDWAQLIQKEQLHQLATASGGDIRDYFRLVSESMIRLLLKPSDTLDAHDLTQVLNQMRNDMLPIAQDDKIWLAEIHSTKQAALPTTDRLPDLARFLDGNLIMNYLNGQPWYDIHPLLQDVIQDPT